jgi:hypothetical protein
VSSKEDSKEGSKEGNKEGSKEGSKELKEGSKEGSKEGVCMLPSVLAHPSCMQILWQHDGGPVGWKVPRKVSDRWGEGGGRRGGRRRGWWFTFHPPKKWRGGEAEREMIEWGEVMREWLPLRKKMQSPKVLVPKGKRKNIKKV